MDTKTLLKTTKIIFNKCFSVFALIFFWEVGAKLHLFKTLYFPPPSDVMARLFYLFSHNNTGFLKDIISSSYRFFVASIISVPLAILLGISIGLNKLIEKFFNPLIAITYPIPKLAILPLLLLLFGINDTSKILMIAISIFYLVMINTIMGVKRLTSSEYIDIVKIYKIPKLKKIFKIYIRGSLPEILTGIKIGLGYGLVMIVGSEMIVSKNGIGLFIWNAWDQFRPIDLYCGLYVLSLAGILIFFSFDAIIEKLNK